MARSMAMLAPWIRVGGREHALHVIIEERSVRTRATVAHGGRGTCVRVQRAHGAVANQAAPLLLNIVWYL